jgi:hypothetical protein
VREGEVVVSTAQKQRRKEREERKKKERGRFPLLSLGQNPREKREKRERGRGEKERDHAKNMCPSVTREHVHKCEHIKRTIKR